MRPSRPYGRGSGWARRRALAAPRRSARRSGVICRPGLACLGPYIANHIHVGHARYPALAQEMDALKGHAAPGFRAGISAIFSRAVLARRFMRRGWPASWVSLWVGSPRGLRPSALRRGTRVAARLPGSLISRRSSSWAGGCPARLWAPASTVGRPGPGISTSGLRERVAASSGTLHRATSPSIRLARTAAHARRLYPVFSSLNRPAWPPFTSPAERIPVAPRSPESDPPRRSPPSSRSSPLPPPSGCPTTRCSRPVGRVR